MPVPRNSTFMGREEELRTIHECLSGSKSKDIPYIFALTGTGGMGKTQIAVEYAYRYQHEYTAIFWVSTASEDTIRSSFIDVMQRIVEAQARITWPESPPDYEIVSRKLGIRIPGIINSRGVINSDLGNAKEIKSALFHWLQLPGNCKWLLIFDNADNLETFDVQGYFPNHGGGKILITSRRPEFSQKAEQLWLDGLDRESAIKLLLRLASIGLTEGKP